MIQNFYIKSVHLSLKAKKRSLGSRRKSEFKSFDETKSLDEFNKIMNYGADSLFLRQDTDNSLNSSRRWVYFWHIIIYNTYLEANKIIIRHDFIEYISIFKVFGYSVFFF